MIDGKQFRTAAFWLMLAMTGISGALALEIIPASPTELWHKLAALALLLLNFTLYGFHRATVNVAAQAAAPPNVISMNLPTSKNNSGEE